MGLSNLIEATKITLGAFKGSGFKAGLEHTGKKIGRRAAITTASRGYGMLVGAAAVGGVGAAIASEHPLQGAVNNALDMAFYDPALEAQGIRGRDVDNSVLGYDLGFSDMFLPSNLNYHNVRPFGLPSMRDMKRAFSVENFRNTASFDKNQFKMNANARNYAEDQASKIAARGVGNNEFWDAALGLPYQAPTRRGPVYSSGDQVLGMYNRRHS